MNVAIVIGVNNYISINKLPGSKNDAELFYNCLLLSKKYLKDNILYLNSDEDSTKIKSDISEFISKYQSDGAINELLFYFSGHGKAEPDISEYYHLLSDYNKDKLNTTSLKNTDLDMQFKSLTPKLTVKIIDACYSGFSYIKNIENIEKSISKSPGYNDCYFFYSSLTSQVSRATHQISYFTQSILNYLLECKNTKIRFSDMQSAIIDYFTSNHPDQSPYFVNQTKGTEIFIEKNSELIEYLNVEFHKLFSSKSPEENSDLQNKPEIKEISVIDKIKKDAEKYCDERELQHFFKKAEEEFSQLNFGPEITELFDINVNIAKSFSEFQYINNLNNIGEWLNKNPSKYFATPTYCEEVYKSFEIVPIPSNNRGIMSLFNHPNYERFPVDKIRNVINGYENTISIPFKGINIVLNPKYQNLVAFVCNILLIVSKIHVRYIYSFSKLNETNWKIYTLDNKLEWKTTEYNLKNYEVSTKRISDIISSFVAAVKDSYSHIVKE